MKNEFTLIADALNYLSENRRNQPTLPELARHVGVSPWHFQKMFSRFAGVSPKRVLQHLTALDAGELLRKRVSVLDASLEVGLSGGSRLHDLFVTIHGMSPAAYRDSGSDIEITYGTCVSPFGTALIATTDLGICWLSFHLEDSMTNGVNSGLEQLRQEWSRSHLVRHDQRIARLSRQLFGEIDRHEPVHVLVKGTNFQIRVWQALLKIPAGAISTYGDVSRAIDVPRASRAVGSAVGCNSVAWLIPCHRVIRSNGLIGDYRWGPGTKTMMILKESVRSEPSQLIAV